MIYEYRTYEVVPGRMVDLHARFRDHTVRLFARHEIVPVAFFTPRLGGASDQLIYILAFSDLAHRERAWAAFEADPEWQQAKSDSEGDTGPLVVRVRAEIFAPTDYSPLQ
jgi:hypothetical protein